MQKGWEVTTVGRREEAHGICVVNDGEANGRAGEMAQRVKGFAAKPARLS